MRLQHKEVTDIAAILAILDRCEVLRLGLSDNDQPYIVPLFYYYEQDGEQLYLYMHCAREGKKLEILNRNRRVCFEADVHRIDYEDVEYEYASVIGEGTVDFISDHARKAAIINTLRKRYGATDIKEYPDSTLELTTVLRLCVDRISGKDSPPKVKK